MNTASICRILEKAARLNVASLKIEALGLEVEFSPPVPKAEWVINYPSADEQLEEPVPPADVYQSAPNAAHSPPDSGDSVVFDEEPRSPQEIADELDLDELLIADPLELEERIARGELVDVETEDH